MKYPCDDSEGFDEIYEKVVNGEITYPEFEGFEESETGFAGAMVEYGSNGFVLIASPSSDVSAEKVKGGEVCILNFATLQLCK